MPEILYEGTTGTEVNNIHSQKKEYAPSSLRSLVHGWVAREGGDSGESV